MKQIIVGTLAICLCILMCACGVNEQGQNGNSNTGIVDVDTGKEFADMIAGYVNSGDYISAIQYYDSLSDSIKNKSSVAAAYINAVSAYKSDVIRQVDNYVAAGDFTAARSLLTVAENQIGNDVTISAKMKEVNEKELLKTVLEFEAAKNYEAAILYLNQNSSFVSGSMELQVKLETYKEQYRAAVIAQAADAYKNNGVDAAISAINDALKVLNHDSILMSEREKYENIAPKKLSSLEVFSYGSKGKSNVNTNKYIKDRYNNNYNSSFSVKEEVKIKWILNQDYEKFTGTIACPDGFSYNSYYSNVIVTIYCDGEMVYKSNPSGPDEKPQSFAIDLNGVEELEIKWKCQEALNIWYNWCAYATIFDGMLFPVAPD